MPTLTETINLLRSRHARSRWRDVRALRALPDIEFDTAGLRRLDPAVLADVFDNQAWRRDWNSALARREAAGFHINFRGSSGFDDGWILYSLVRYLQPRRVLEVGTYMGSGTTTLTQALATNTTDDGCPAGSLTTVDMRDANSPQGPWALYGANRSPRDNLAALDLDHLVEFVHGSSLDYIPHAARDERTKYDLIFLDGDHRAHIVYREVPMALDALAPDGVILLHDYWADYDAHDDVCYGPAMAAERLCALRPDLQIIDARAVLNDGDPSGEAFSTIAIVSRRSSG